MLRASLLVLLGCFTIFAASPDVALTGTVKDGTGKALSGVKVSLVKVASLKDTTDSTGKFELKTTVGIAKPYDISVRNPSSSMGINGTRIQFSLSSEAKNGSIEIFSNNGRRNALIPLGKLQAGAHYRELPQLSAGFYVMNITLDQAITTMGLVKAGSMLYVKKTRIGAVSGGPARSAAGTAPLDTLVAEATGYITTKVPLDSYQKSDIPVTLTAGSSTCPEVPKLPAASALTYNNSKLPDPFEFKFMDLPRVTTKAQWECRRAEINAIAQEYLYGHMPPKPEVTGTVNGGKITANCKYNGKTASFSVTANGSGDILVFEFGMGAPKPANSRSCGLDAGSMINTMRSLYGSTDVGTCMAVAWGVGRIIDVLEQNPDGGIDATKVVTTGCSTNGKLALIAGIFEPRVAICVPVESGACGTCSWRVAKSYGGGDSNKNCQDINHLEQNWLGDVAKPFRDGLSIDKLPIDQHEVMALRAPRPMIAFNNYKEWKWLCAKGNVAAAQGCHWIYKALGASDNFGFAESQADHSHCTFPNEHKSELQAFYDKFLNGKADANTKVMRWNSQSQETEKWFDWDTTVVLQ